MALVFHLIILHISPKDKQKKSKCMFDTEKTNTRNENAYIPTLILIELLLHIEKSFETII